ncbi:unnamed protein product, partial [Urochloa humidicola]
PPHAAARLRVLRPHRPSGASALLRRVTPPPPPSSLGRRTCPPLSKQGRHAAPRQGRRAEGGRAAPRQGRRARARRSRHPTPARSAASPCRDASPRTASRLWDYSQQRRVAKDLHGTEWRFRHICRDDESEKGSCVSPHSKLTYRSEVITTFMYMYTRQELSCIYIYIDACSILPKQLLKKDRRNHDKWVV